MVEGTRRQRNGLFIFSVLVIVLLGVARLVRNWPQSFIRFLTEPGKDRSIKCRSGMVFVVR